MGPPHNVCVAHLRFLQPVMRVAIALMTGWLEVARPKVRKVSQTMLEHSEVYLVASPEILVHLVG